jgi:hypothetical protein
MAKSLLSTLGRNFATGLGRQAGFRTWKQLEKEVAKKVIDPNSKLRKHIQKFTLPGTAKAAVSKVWTLIALFEEEYGDNSSMFQQTYMLGDIDFITKKITAIERLCNTQDDIDLFEHIRDSWNRLTNLK